MLKRLKLLREESGLSQKALAECVGVSQQSINKYENHNVEPDIETLIRIAGRLNTSVDYLIGAAALRSDMSGCASGELSREELNLIADYRTLNPQQQYSIRLIMENYRQLPNREPQAD